MIHTATDFDGDMLVYSLYTPLAGPNDPVNYEAGYTFTSPVNNNFFTLANGEVSVWPTEQIVHFGN